MISQTMDTVFHTVLFLTTLVYVVTSTVASEDNKTPNNYNNQNTNQSNDVTPGRNDPAPTPTQETPKGPFFITEPPTSLEFLNTDGALAPCSAYGSPAPALEWVWADTNKPVDNVEGLLEVKPNGSIQFLPFRDPAYFDSTIHEGRLRCVASNSAGSIVSRTMQIKTVLRRYFATYTVRVNNVDVTVGDTAILTCLVNPRYVSEYVVVTGWKTAQQELVPVQQGNKYRILQSLGELHVLRTVVEDSYEVYYCITHNLMTGENKTSEGAVLSTHDAVNSAPIMYDGYSSLTVKVSQGMTAELPCVASGHPSSSYTWSRDDQPILIGQDRIQQVAGNLVIASVTVRDSGQYKCQAENDQGVAESEVSLIITAPLSAFVNPSQQTVDVGKPAIFNCTVYGHPVESVTWYKDGQPLLLENGRIHTSDDTRLVIERVERQDQGMFQCLVTGEEDNAQAAGQLTLGDAAPVITDVSPVQIVTPGSKVNLKCVAIGTPTPDISWSLDGEEVVADDNHSVGQFTTPDGTAVGYVNVTHALVLDGGQYVCTAVSNVGSDSGSMKLNVLGVPFIRPMKNLTAVANQMLTLRCPVIGYPVANISWSKDEVRLPTSTRQQVRDGTLTVQDVGSLQDSGQYTCEARNANGDGMKRSVFVSILEPPKVDAFTFGQKKEHDRVTVSCTVSSGDLPIRITWTKDTKPLPAHVTPTMINEYTSNLELDDVRKDDSGNYTCTATNAAASVSHTAKLQVNVSPTWVSAPQDTPVLSHGDVLISCSAEGDPKPTIMWKKARGPEKSDFEELDYASLHPRISQLDNGSLSIRTAREEDGGYYSCLASNGVDVGLSMIVQLIVYVPARFTERERNYTVHSGQKVTLECTSLGHTPLSIAWSFNGTSLDLQNNNSRLLLEYDDLPKGRTSRLTIRQTQRRDTGFYVCSTLNAFGSDFMMIELIVQEVPDPPQKVEVIAGGSGEVTLSWGPAFNGNSPILHYIIQYKVESVDWEGNSTGSLTVEAEARSVEIQGLHPAYAYQLRVRAHNSVGLSKPSQEQLYITGEEEPTGPPTDVQVVATGSQTLRVAWKPPDLDKQNGEILGYYVGYKIFNSSAPYMYLTKSLDEGVRSIAELEEEIAGLEKFTKYAVHVQAFNKQGAGPRSGDVARLTLEDVPSQPPQSVQGAPRSSTVIVIRWSSPPLYNLHGILQGYKVIFKPVRADEDESDEMVVTSTSLNAALYDLEKYTNYSIEVLAYTRMGEGVRSSPIYVVTLQDYPEVPADIKATTGSSDSILVTWKPPLHSNGIITRYTVHVRDLTNSQEIMTDLVPAGLSLMVQNLEPDHKYGFRVGASTIVGKGPLTREVTAFTENTAAAKIGSFSGTVYAPWLKDVILPCVAVGTPRPKITWTFRGLEIIPDSKRQVFGNGSLWLTDLKGMDAGQYACHAENKHGADEITVSLVVEAFIKSPPKEPTMKVAATTTSSIQVNWRTGSNGGDKIQGFTLYFKKEHAEWTVVQLGSQNRSYTTSDLECGTAYKFHMRAHNSLGEGMPSQTVTAKTNGSAPIMPPQNLILVHINSTFVVLDLQSWQTGGCPITGYHIQYQVMGDTSWTTVVEKLDPHTVLYTVELHPETWYVVRVTAHNDAGSTESLLKFGTKTFYGSTIEPIRIVHKKDQEVYKRAYVIVPLCFIVIVLVVAAAWIALYRRRRREELKCKAQNKTNLRKDLTAETSLMSDLEKSLGDLTGAGNPSGPASRGRNINLLANQNEDANRKLPSGEQRTSWIFASSGKAVKDVGSGKNTDGISTYATLRSLPLKGTPIKNNPEKICNLDRKENDRRHSGPLPPPPPELLVPPTPSSADSGVILNPNGYANTSDDLLKTYGLSTGSPRHQRPLPTPQRPTPMPWKGLRHRPSTVSVSTVSPTQDELMQAFQNDTLPSVPTVSFDPDKPSSVQTVSTDTSSEVPPLCRFTQSPALPNESRLARCEVPWYNQPASRTTPGPGLLNAPQPSHQTTQKPSPQTRNPAHVVAKKLFGVHCQPKSSSSSSSSSASDVDTASEDIGCSYEEDDETSRHPSESSSSRGISEVSTRHPSSLCSSRTSSQYPSLSSISSSRGNMQQSDAEDYERYLSTPRSRARPSHYPSDPAESCPLVGRVPAPLSQHQVEARGDDFKLRLLDRRYRPVRGDCIEEEDDDGDEEEEEEDVSYGQDFIAV